MTFLIGYLAILLIFGVLDAVWLSTMAQLMYRPTLGDLLLDGVRWVPALIFYFGFPLGIMYFAVLPGYRADSLALAAGNGALLGMLAYGTYDLTNYATLRAWTLQITLADIAYGTLAIGLVSALTYGVLKLASNWGLI